MNRAVPSEANASDADPLVGATIDGKYRISRALGQGNMGAVYEAEDSGTGRRVAIKVVLRERLARDAKALARFHLEARAARVESPHIARVLDSGVDARLDTPFLVMELLEGEDLLSLLDRLGPLPVDLALRVVSQALRGLEEAHRAGIVHRDVKPANIHLSREGDERRIKLLDFGIAKVIDPVNPDGAGLTSTGTLLGSPLYMSPEQVRGRGGVDHRTDLWSMGVVLYVTLAGRAPHHDAETMGALIMAICSEQAPPLAEVAPWVPVEVDAILGEALAIQPERRFSSASAMRAAVFRLLPGGDAIDDAMLVPLAPAARAARPAIGVPSAAETAKTVESTFDTAATRALARPDPVAEPTPAAAPSPPAAAPAPIAPLDDGGDPHTPASAIAVPGPLPAPAPGATRWILAVLVLLVVVAVLAAARFLGAR